MKQGFLSLISRLLVVSMLMLPFQSIQAGMVGTDQVSAAASAQASRDAVLATLARAEVASQLQAMGIDSSAAKARVSAMTDDEVRTLQSQIDSMPAGALSGWAWAGIVAVAVLIWYLYTQK
jgi:hypothetical protein